MTIDVVNAGLRVEEVECDLHHRVTGRDLKAQLHRAAQYRDVIAADYAYVFLERNLRVGLAALDKDYQLQKTQREQAVQIRQRALVMLQQLSQEKNLLYQKVGSYRAVSSHLEQLERQLRSSMPQHVMDMLGQQAAYMAR